MDFGVTFQTDPPASRVVELTQRAEALGFTHAWTFDSHILWQEPYVIYALMLAATERIMVGPFVTNPATRDPTVTASRFATRNHTVGHRPLCGIGRGGAARPGLGQHPTTRAEPEEKPEPSLPKQLRVAPGAGVDMAAIKRELRAVLDQLNG